ncbi:MAG: succinate dehydrogenase assembly factor 2 [Gammaproteobacteria bacterium]|nr:succinate dehydrogenase assembly factor 2 [Gammaproteobacteria bacterium]MCP5299538.1 succinate dehydrogenase assembly factor 2 [Chromatiaceae bacterium]
MTQPVDDRERLRWQCRRGMLELDYVLERYLNDHFTTADAAERERFGDLLASQDPELQLWLLNGVAHPDASYQTLIAKIRGYDGD